MAISAPAPPVEAPAESVTVQLPASLAAILRGKAQEEGCSVPQLIADALVDWCGFRDLYPDLDAETIERFRCAIQEAVDDPRPYLIREQVFPPLLRKFRDLAEAAERHTK